MAEVPEWLNQPFNESDPNRTPEQVVAGEEVARIEADLAALAARHEAYVEGKRAEAVSRFKFAAVLLVAAPVIGVAGYPMAAIFVFVGAIGTAVSALRYYLRSL